MRTGPFRHHAGIVVPLRSFTLGKARLAAALDDTARAELARQMAERVVAAAGATPLVVVSSAPEVVEWAAGHDLACIDDPGSLNEAADAGRSWVIDQELARVAIVHADLPLVTTLAGVVAAGAARVAVVVPDQRDDGTPVLSIPVDAPFRFAYGPGSFQLHVAEAAHAGLEVDVVRDDELGFDVDVPEDLARLELRPR